jgi:alpha-beta hydrolase superfamily lysophospholipase
MGGLIALGCDAVGSARPDLLVLSAPGLDDDLAAWKHAAAPILGRIAPRLQMPDGITLPCARVTRLGRPPRPATR